MAGRPAVRSLTRRVVGWLYTNGQLVRPNTAVIVGQRSWFAVVDRVAEKEIGMRDEYLKGVLSSEKKNLDSSEIAARDEFNRQHPPIKGLVVDAADLSNELEKLLGGESSIEGWVFR